MNFLKKLFPPLFITYKIRSNGLYSEYTKDLSRHPQICPVCHRHSQDFEVCTNCKSKVFFDGIFINYIYRGQLKKEILNLKFLHFYSTAKDLSKLFNIDILDKLDRDKIIVSYVPNHWFRRHFIKGYNQSKLLAKYFAQYNGLSFLSTTKKIKYTKSQTQLNRQQRLSNLRGSFEIIPSINLKGDETIIIVDDITTTGSTINEIAQTMKAYFPKLKIWGMVLARNN